MAVIAFIGAGSAVFAKRLLGDIVRTDALRESEIRLMDIDAERLEITRRLAELIVQQEAVPIRLSATTDRRRALDGATYVINAVQVGGLDATLKDFEIPAKYGVRQTIADTLGVGGVMRFLRTAPVVEGLLRDMEQLCPDAILLNYANPMAMLCLLASRISRVRVIGLCHSVRNTAMRLAKYMGIPSDDLEFIAAGINHMAWFLQLRYHGQDVYPRLREASRDPAVFEQDPVRFEVMRLVGYFMTESSEHLAEYLPWFMKSPEMIRRLKIPVNEYIRRMERNLEHVESLKGAVERRERFELVPSGEDAATIIAASETGRPSRVYGNVPNDGWISNLPHESVVEVPCFVDRYGIHPTQVGALPLQLAALNASNVLVQQLAVEAYVSRRKEHVYHAVLVDPNAASALTPDRITEMVDDLIRAHARDLPAWVVR